MTSRSRLSVVLFMVFVTLLSAVVYLRGPFQTVKEVAIENYRPRQRHLEGVARPTPSPKLLQNATVGNSVRPATRLSPAGTSVPKNASVIVNHKTIGPTSDFMLVNSGEQRARKNVVRQACKQYGRRTTGDPVGRIPGNVFVDDKHKVVYCSVPKIACTSWKKVFLVLNKSFNNTSEISQYFANRDGQKMLTKLRDLPPSEVQRILKTYTKFMFARHPFSRVLSAFRNKLDPGSSFERAGVWQRTVGNRILSKYRGNRQPEVSQYDLTFEEFVKYLTDPEVPRHESSNKHWSRIYDQCMPCDIDYDIIGKFETLRNDSKYILRLIHAEDVTFPGSDSSSPTGSSNQTKLESYYKGVPLVDLQRLYERFKTDFDIFGYDPPTLAFKGS